MKFFLVFFITFLYYNLCLCQINLDFTKQNCFKINVYSEGYPIKTGSGFILKTFKNTGKNLCIGISNVHVLDGGDSITVQFADNTYSLTYFDFIDVEKDLISFQFASIDYKVGFISLLKYSYHQGDVIYTMSNPKGLNYSLSKGEIASIRKDYDNEFIQFTAAASPGSSGSPLLSTKGEFLGVVSRQINGGQNLNFALSTKSAKDFFGKYNQPTLINNSQTKLIKRIFNYKSESSPIIKLLRDKIGGSKPTLELYNLLEENKRYVLLDNYCLIQKITIEVENKLFQNALESFSSYNDNFGFSSGITQLQYIGVIDKLATEDKKLLLDYSDFNDIMQKEYSMEPLFIYLSAVLKFKLKDYYSAISSGIKFTNYKAEFDKDNNFSSLKHSNSFNKIMVASAYRIIADSYNELQNYKLAEENYIDAIDNSILIGDWCKNSKSLISFYLNHKDYKRLCRLAKAMEQQSNYPKCNLEELRSAIQELCELQ